MALKVFDLQCANGHVFEGWFASRESFDDQKERGLLSCPVCGGHKVERKLSAARINLGKAPTRPAAGAESASHGTAMASVDPEKVKMQAQMLQKMRELVRSTENVGDRFAQEARSIHAGESEERAIRGTTTREEREALAEEGIGVVQIPDFLDDDRMQ